MKSESIKNKLINQVVKKGVCTGCGACVFLDNSGKSQMKDTKKGPVPLFSPAHLSSQPPVSGSQNGSPLIPVY